MIQSPLSILAGILNAKTETPEATIQGVSIDTRTVQPGNLFIAIQGERVDGHDFIEEAYRKGATAALVQRKMPCSIPQIQVQNTITALGNIAAYWRNQFSLPLIAVTGSNGKTTLKNMISSILLADSHNDAAQVLATTGNFNNHIGLPLNLLRLGHEHRHGVLEMGMNHPGEIAYLTKMARPTVAIINNAAAAHLEGLHDVAGVARAKGEIFLGLQPNGVGILNKDDPFFDLWRNLLGTHDAITFGLQNNADVSATLPTALGDHPIICIDTPIGQIDVRLALPGLHNIKNALAATAAALAIEVDLATIKAGLENVKAAPGRLQIHALSPTVRLIDDTYNANPASVHAAIDLLATQEGLKILVLGDMKELGPDVNKLHFSAGEKALAAGIDRLFTYGNFTSETAKAFGKQAEHFTDQSTLAEAIKPLLEQSATILVKGSRSMHMENVITKLKEIKIKEV